MHTRTKWLWGGALALVGVLGLALARPAPRVVSAAAPPVAMLGARGAPASSSAGLALRVTAMEERLSARHGDAAATVALAEALLRQARATGTMAPAARAEAVLRDLLREEPANVQGLRMLGAALLSRHAFADARDVGRRVRQQAPSDPWALGVVGDASLELGDYAAAFDAFQSMMDLRPSAAAYARVSYARELQGDIDGALENMRLALGATSPADPEAYAWASAQLGELSFRAGRLDEADAAWRAAERAFPDYALAATGRACLLAARGRDADALALATRWLDRSPSLALAALVGDLYASGGDAARAEHFYAVAEQIGRSGAGSDESLAGFLAERGRRLDEAVALARRAAAVRQDISTMDALAWASFRQGDLATARDASARALRTGTRDRRVLLHAAAIARASGQPVEADRLAARALPRHPTFDVLAAALARRPRASS